MLKEHKGFPALDGRGLRGGCPKSSPPYQVRGRLQSSLIIKRERGLFGCCKKKFLCTLRLQLPLRTVFVIFYNNIHLLQAVAYLISFLPLFALSKF